MKQIHLNHCDKLISEAQTLLNDAQTILSDLSQDTAVDESISTEDHIFMVQLVLQYRLNTNDVLTLLFKIDRDLLALLGIEPGQSAHMNLDRLVCALGNEDLKQMLNLLSMLILSLSKIVSRHKAAHLSFIDHHQKIKPNKRLVALNKLVTTQHQLVETLNQLHLDSKQLVAFQENGPVLNYVGALRGPISQFHQAIVNGLDQMETLYHQLIKDPIVNNQLNFLLKKAEETLNLMPLVYPPRPQPVYTPPAPQVTPEQLEERARAKRLRPFFG
ncbi:MAG: hypothetical protein NTW08_04390 [Gammaproteobacteria bacterium]|nr:hypothetical protein [Gammaproteobacteria bacterium]